MSRVSPTITAVATDTRRIALVGNPNAGKSSLFNLLTGLNQKVGNYPGVTVDKKTGRCLLAPNLKAEVLDLPGTYSVFPRSGDEQVVLDTLMNDSFDAVVAVVDMVNLERGLLLATQLIDLALPVVLVLNMADIALQQGIEVDTKALSRRLGGVPVTVMNARRGEGLSELKKLLSQPITPAQDHFFDACTMAPEAINATKQGFNLDQDYAAYLLLQHGRTLRHLSPEQQQILENIRASYPLNNAHLQIQETTERYRLIKPLIDDTVTIAPSERVSLTDRIDQIVTHRVGGVPDLLRTAVPNFPSHLRLGHGADGLY